MRLETSLALTLCGQDLAHVPLFGALSSTTAQRRLLHKCFMLNNLLKPELAM